MARMRAVQSVAAETQQVEKVYGVLAKVYDAFFDWALGPGRRYAIQTMNLAPGDRVLEVGVGTGLSLPLYPRHGSITGVDISEAMLRKAEERRVALGRDDVTLLRMDARELEFADASFDHVFAPYVISVVPEPDRVVAEMRRVCRPGGFVTIVNHFQSEHPVLGRLERWLTPLTRWIGFRMDLPLRTVLEVPGLEVLSVERVNLLGHWRLVRLRRAADPRRTQ